MTRPDKPKKLFEAAYPVKAVYAAKLDADGKPVNPVAIDTQAKVIHFSFEPDEAKPENMALTLPTFEIKATGVITGALSLFSPAYLYRLPKHTTRHWFTSRHSGKPDRDGIEQIRIVGYRIRANQFSQRWNTLTVEQRDLLVTASGVGKLEMLKTADTLSAQALENDHLLSIFYIDPRYAICRITEIGRLVVVSGRHHTDKAS